MIAKLKKLKGRSLGEIMFRAKQTLSALAEQAGPLANVRSRDRSSFVRSLWEKGLGGPADVLKHFRQREHLFFPSFSDRDGTLAALRERFPRERDGIIQRAEKLLSGSYDLLGHTDLSFGPALPDWHFDPISGKRSPLRHWSRFDETDPSETGDKKVIWELNRQQYFTTLGQAYWITGDEAYADAFLAHVEDWIENNPPKLGVNWISSLEIAYRSMSWIWAFHYFKDSSSIRPDIFVKMLNGLVWNAQHIERYLSTYSSPNTHLTGEALGLYFIGTFLQGFAGADRWARTGYAILIGELDRQIRADGGYVEQATHYQRYTADFYLALAILRRAEGIELDTVLEAKLAKLLEFLMYLIQPNGEVPLIGDEDGGRLHVFDDRSIADLRPMLSVGAAVFNDGRLKFAAGEASDELLWLTGPAGLAAFDSLKAVPMHEMGQAFQESGAYVVRDPSSFVVIDCGQHGFMNCGHAHADALSFVASFLGVPVFVDSGTYTYTADRNARDYFRSSSAHNCLTVNGSGSAEPNGPFSWKHWPDSKVLEWNCDDPEAVFRGSHNGYERFGVEYEREFRINRSSGVILIDKVRTNVSNKFAINFILSPLIEAEMRSDDRIILRPKDGKQDLLAIVTKVIGETSGDERGAWQIEPTHISPRYGMLVPTTKLIFSIDRNADFEVENRFVLSRTK